MVCSELAFIWKTEQEQASSKMGNRETTKYLLKRRLLSLLPLFNSMVARE